MTLLICLFAFLTATPAQADTVDQSLTRARAQYRDLEYEKVITLSRAVAGDSRSSVDQRVEALELLGLSSLILGREKKAGEAFLRLLRIRPGHRLRDPSGSPKLRTFFHKVRDTLPPPARPPTLRLLRPRGMAVAGKRVKIKAALANLRWADHIGLLRWRRSGETSWQSTPARPEGSALAANLLLPKSSSGYRVQYYMAVHDTDGIQVIAAGSAGAPQELAVRAAKSSSSLLRSWWLWTAVGVVVVAGATVGIVALASQDAPRGNMQPGVIQLP